MERRRCRNSGRSGGIAIGYGGFTQSLCPGLLPLRVLDAVRRLGHELEPLVRDAAAADDAAAVFPALHAAKPFVDELDPGLEHSLPGDVELACFGLARGVRRVLIGKSYVATGVALRDRQALADPLDGAFEIGALALEPLSHRRFVHRPPPMRQNRTVLPTDVSKRRSELHLVDVREPDEWDAGHIEGAQHIPLGDLAARLDEIPRDRTVVAVCRSGSRSDRAAKGLRASGFAAENLDGGVTAWTRAGLPLVDNAGRPGRVI